MLKININKIRIPLALGALGLGGIFLFQYLAFIPEYSSAEEISTDTPVTITPTTPLAKWDDLEYMQQMSPQACAEGNETGKQLVDARDGKSYWVAKLKDDNCWMTQNLDYDDPDGIKITNADGAGGGPNADWENDVSRR